MTRLAGAPVQVVSTGNPFLFVPLRDRATVDRAAFDVLAPTPAGAEAALGTFVFAPDGPGQVYSRMFAPHTAGIPEDPATGSAGGPLGAYLVRHGLAPAAGDVRILSLQGVKMGRPSRVHIRLRARAGQATALRVGGAVAPVLDGRLRLP